VREFESLSIAPPIRKLLIPLVPESSISDPDWTDFFWKRYEVFKYLQFV